MINVGIIGYGKMGEIRHDVANTIDGVNVVSIYDSSVVKTEIKIEKSANDIFSSSLEVKSLVKKIAKLIEIDFKGIITRHSNINCRYFSFIHFLLL